MTKSVNFDWCVGTKLKNRAPTEHRTYRGTQINVLKMSDIVYFDNVFLDTNSQNPNIFLDFVTCNFLNKKFTSMCRQDLYYSSPQQNTKLADGKLMDTSDPPFYIKPQYINLYVCITYYLLVVCICTWLWAFRGREGRNLLLLGHFCDRSLWVGFKDSDFMVEITIILLKHQSKSELPSRTS